jgi:hypothetical protein
MGQIFQSACPSSSSATQTAKAQMEMAFTIMMEKRMAEEATVAAGQEAGPAVVQQV